MDEEFSPVPGPTPNLEQLGRFILTTDETLIRHRVIRLGGRHWYRFMDYIYSPKPIHLL